MSAQPERIIVVRRPSSTTERPLRFGKLDLDLDALTLPAIIAGGLVFVAVYKDQIAEVINNATQLLDIPLTIPIEPGTPSTPSTPKPPTTTPKPPSSGGGGVATGSQWYKATGSTTNLSTGRQDGESNRWNKNVTGWSDGFEVMGYLTVTGMGSGSHIGLKMAGPNHSGNCGYKQGGSCCCWWDGGLRRNGASYLEIEYPHPTNKNQKMFKNMGRNIDAGVLGVRWLNMKEGSARRVMFWIDKSGKANGYKWELMYDVKDTGQFMPTSYYNKIPNEIELEIRISDVSASKIKWHTGPVGRQIKSTSNLAYAYDARTYYDRITLA